MKISTVKLLGMIATIASAVGTLLSFVIGDKMESIRIAEEVDKALANRTE